MYEEERNKNEALKVYKQDSFKPNWSKSFEADEEIDKENFIQQNVSSWFGKVLWHTPH